ncbi:MAG: TIGR02221 family CRISPR-associated protein [Peptococcaceae bacterium]|jgi:CRISPR-associated Csx2 family protein|nr:TIGR02221 family CRISPR-associated protein [Peptococcaceae bacterium]
MAKVLIASIGRGNPAAKNYAYSDAAYCLADAPGGAVRETPLVAAALKEIYNIDEIILVGTAGSSWGPLYDYIHSPDNKYFPRHGDYDENYHLDLLDIYDKSGGLETRLTVAETQKRLARLKDTLGDFCRDIVVLEYGVTADEQLSNLTILNRLATSLKDGDVIYFDISHSFRSLPFYELLAVNLAKSVSRRDIRIEMVSYAMFEASGLYAGKTPIADMTQLIELLDWTRAIDEFNRKGKFDLLQELLKSENKIGQYIRGKMNRPLRQAFSRLVETLSANNHGDLKGMIAMVGTALQNFNQDESGSESGSDASNPVVLKFIYDIMTRVYEDFKPYKDDQIALLLASVEWKIKKGQDVLGALLLMDASESMCLDVLGKKIDDDNEHYLVHDKMRLARSGDPDVKEFLKGYNENRRMRNALAHVTSGKDNGLSPRLKSAAEYFKRGYLERFAPGKPGRELLREALEQALSDK